MEVGTQLRCIVKVVGGTATSKKTGNPYNWKALEIQIGDYKLSQRIFLNNDIEYIIDQELKKAAK